MAEKVFWCGKTIFDFGKSGAQDETVVEHKPRASSSVAGIELWTCVEDGVPYNTTAAQNPVKKRTEREIASV